MHRHTSTRGDFEITVDIETGIVQGKFPPRALRHVLEWRELHKEELLNDRDLCRQAEMPNPTAGVTP